ncbi:MAG: phage holin family protein [Bergeyella cardium]
MIADLINGNAANWKFQLLTISGVWMAVLIAILIDLYFGVRKAKSLGECTTSQGYTRTIKKVTFYYGMLVFACLFDFLDMITPLIFPYPLSIAPIGTIFGGIILILVEGKSVMEKAEAKQRRQVENSLKTLLEAVKNKEQLTDEILSILKEKANRNETSN